jgi:hypothetical protein
MTYVYRGDGPTPEQEDRLTAKQRADRRQFVKEIVEEWEGYERGNARSNKRYRDDTATIDARYDPKGGGRRWAGQ